MAGQNDGKMNEGKRERRSALILKKVTKKTGKLNFAENDEFWNIALRGVEKGRVGGRQNAESHGKGAKDAK